MPIPSLGRLLFLLLLVLLLLLLPSDFLLDDFFIDVEAVDNVEEEADNPRFFEEAGPEIVVAAVTDETSPLAPPPTPPAPPDNIRSSATSTLYPLLRNATDNSFSEICDVIPILEMKFRSVDSLERKVLLELLFVESVIVFYAVLVYLCVVSENEVDNL